MEPILNEMFDITRISPIVKCGEAGCFVAEREKRNESPSSFSVEAFLANLEPHSNIANISAWAVSWSKPAVGHQDKGQIPPSPARSNCSFKPQNFLTYYSRAVGIIELQ